MNRSNHPNTNLRSDDPLIERFLDTIFTSHERIVAVYPFGPRCRDDSRPGSDYDPVRVVKERTRDLRDTINDAVLDMLLVTGRFFSLKIMKLDEITGYASLPTPFVGNVLREETQIG